MREREGERVRGGGGGREGGRQGRGERGPRGRDAEGGRNINVKRECLKSKRTQFECANLENKI